MRPGGFIATKSIWVLSRWRSGRGTQGRSTPVSKQVPRTEAEAVLGNRFAKDALALSPTDRSARIVQISLNLEKAIERAGFTKFNAQDDAEFKAATAAGPALLIERAEDRDCRRQDRSCCRECFGTGRCDRRASPRCGGRPHPLVDALYSPGRRLQFAAARAIVKLRRLVPFPGAGRVVPTLARFLPTQVLGRAIVIDANPTRGSQLAGFLISLGYDSELKRTEHVDSGRPLSQPMSSWS